MKLFELYRETEGPDDGAFHNGNLYSVNKLVELSQDLPTEDVSLEDLEWMFPMDGVQPERVAKADKSAPIILTPWESHLVVLDGAHRLSKAREDGDDTIPAKIIPSSMLEKALKNK